MITSDTDYSHPLALPYNTPEQAETRLHSLEQAARGHKTKSMMVPSPY